MAVRLPPLFNHQTYSPRLQAELLALGSGQSRPHLSLIVALLTVLTSMAPLPPALTVPWLLGAFLAATLGFAFRYRYRDCDRRPMTREALRRGEVFGLCYSASVGVLWGFSSQLMVPGNAEHNLIITMIYLGVCAGAGAIAIFGLGHLLMGSALSLVLFVSHFPVIFPHRWLFLTVMFGLFHFVVVRMAWERSQIIAANMKLRKEKELLLEQQQLEVQKAHQANQDKSAFLAAASHDLRQPVHALMLLGHALRLRVPDGESGALVERILEAGQALSEQFNNLMDLSRLESGAYRLNPSWLPLTDFTARCLNAHRQWATDQQLQLRLRLDYRLRDQAVLADSGLLTRVLDNLLVNAIKFSQPGNSILLTVRLQGGRPVFAVRDQGRGIPADQHQTIFKPYVQLDNPTRDRAKGIGLGLSIVQEAASLLGGEIRLISSPGRGSRFSLTLPEGCWQPIRETHRDSGRLRPPVGGNLKGRRLLLVEDDPMAAAALTAWAGTWGLVVMHYADPGGVTNDVAPDLILCDIRLPGTRDGIDWLSDWLVVWPKARGLLLSGELLPEVHERAEQEGLLLLAKPVDPDLLLQTITGLLR